MDLYMPGAYMPHLSDFLDPYSMFSQDSMKGKPLTKTTEAGQQKKRPRVQAPSAPAPYDGYFESLFTKKQ